MIEMEVDKNRHNFLNFFKSFFSNAREFLNGETKKELVSMLDCEFNNDEDTTIDEESLQFIVSIKGVRRTINLNDFESLMYDIDITDELIYDKKGKPTEASIDSLVKDYIEGVVESICQTSI